jgi:hypothetical protein
VSHRLSSRSPSRPGFVGSRRVSYPADPKRRIRNGPPPPARKVIYFEPVPPRLARNTIIESTFEVGRRFRCTMRINCGELDPGAVMRPIAGEWQPRMPDRRDAVYQLAALTIGARLAVADG